MKHGGFVAKTDGADATLGAKADAEVAGDNSGSVKGALRYVGHWIFDIWDASLHQVKVGIQAGTAIIGAVTQSGTWTVQPGNTANTTAWKVDGSAVTQPVSLAAPTTIYNGKKTVTTAGTRVTLAASQAVQSVTVKALIANTGLIFVGDASVSSTTGFQLSPGDSVTLDVANLATVNLDSAVNGEGVTYIGLN